MSRNRVVHKRKMLWAFLICALGILALIVRLGYRMIARSEHYSVLAEELHQRERDIKAARGTIYDRNGNVLATNRTVCTVSVIHSQITDAEEVVRTLSQLLSLEEDKVRQAVEKVSSREIIQTNVDKTIGDAIRACGLDGVKVDEDYKRYYPYDTLAWRWSTRSI